jgi:hypothetical protein
VEAKSALYQNRTTKRETGLHWARPRVGFGLYKVWLTPVILVTQKDRGLKLAWANSSRDPNSKKPFSKIGLVEWLKV